MSIRGTPSLGKFAQSLQKIGVEGGLLWQSLDSKWLECKVSGISGLGFTVGLPARLNESGILGRRNVLIFRELEQAPNFDNRGGGTARNWLHVGAANRRRVKSASLKEGTTPGR